MKKINKPAEEIHGTIGLTQHSEGVQGVNEIIVQVAEGEYCDWCYLGFPDKCLAFFKKKIEWKYAKNGRRLKCTACLEAIKSTKEKYIRRDIHKKMLEDARCRVEQTDRETGNSIND